MDEPTVSQCIDDIYAALHDNNRELDERIARLKAALAREGMAEAVFEPSKIAQNNRQGRKFMQAYFRRLGVRVAFAGD